MKNALAGLALGIGILLAVPVLATSRITTPAFTLWYVDPPQGSITLVEESPTSYSISLDTLNADLAQATALDQGTYGASDAHFHYSYFWIEASAGFRITGLRVSATVSGELAPGQLPGFPPGYVNNAASLFLDIWTPAGEAGYGLYLDYFDSEESHEFGSSTLELGPLTNFGLNGMVFANAYGIAGGGATASSLAQASISDAVLHVEVSAIPEPGIYAMLLTGLGVLSLVGGQYQHRAFAHAPSKSSE